MKLSEFGSRMAHVDLSAKKAELLKAFQDGVVPESKLRELGIL